MGHEGTKRSRTVIRLIVWQGARGAFGGDIMIYDTHNRAYKLL